VTAFWGYTVCALGRRGFGQYKNGRRMKVAIDCGWTNWV